jgi:hypothetical protein
MQLTIILAMKRKLCEIDEANARAKPASDAEILGVIKETMAIAPTMPADNKLKRMESHRLTTRDGTVS